MADSTEEKTGNSKKVAGKLQLSPDEGLVYQAASIWLLAIVPGYLIVAVCGMLIWESWPTPFSWFMVAIAVPFVLIFTVCPFQKKELKISRGVFVTKIKFLIWTIIKKYEVTADQLKFSSMGISVKNEPKSLFYIFADDKEIEYVAQLARLVIAGELDYENMSARKIEFLNHDSINDYIGRFESSYHTEAETNANANFELPPNLIEYFNEIDKRNRIVKVSIGIVMLAVGLALSCIGYWELCVNSRESSDKFLFLLLVIPVSCMIIFSGISILLASRQRNEKDR